MERVLLARALYRRPKILVLDEGAANLDVETEEMIADLVARLPMTRIIVAHRPALLELPMGFWSCAGERFEKPAPAKDSRRNLDRRPNFPRWRLFEILWA